MKEKRTTIYDIAIRLGISTATVNRALTGKPRVREETRKKVLQAAEEMGFKPNQLARALARGTIRLAVLGFTSFPEFHEPFLRGAREAGEELADFNVETDYFSFDQGASNTSAADAYLVDVLHRIAEGGYDGALVLARRSEAFELLKSRGVYVASAVNDIDPANRGFYICYNGYVAGRMAAELIYRWLPRRDLPVAIASGWEDMSIHSRMVAGFMRQVEITPLRLHSICYNRDNEEIAYENTRKLLSDVPDLGAIYVNSFNSAGVIRAVRDAGRAGELLLVTSDINDELKACIEEGVVTASIFQNQYEQGKRGLQTLFRALANGETPPETIVIDPQLILRSNLSLF